MRLTDHFGRTADVIAMSLTIYEDFRVLPAKAQLFDTRAYLRRRGNEVRIYEDVPFRRDNKVAGKVLATHVVEVVRDFEWRNGCRPRRVYFRKSGHWRAK
jgi:hypothetical protein